LGGIELQALADGIVRIAVTKMAGAIKEISVEKGRDPRDYVLVPYGGAGPMHAADIAEELGISTILVPRSPGNLSAFGLIVSDVRHDDVRTCINILEKTDSSLLEREFEAMETCGRSSLQGEGFGDSDIRFQRSLDLRCRGQAFELTIQVEKGESVGSIAERFHQRFHEAYGHSHPERSVELVNLRLSSCGAVKKPVLAATESGRAPSGQPKKGERPVYFQGRIWDTPVYERSFLPSGEILKGPAIVEESGATTVIPPEWVAKVDSYHNLLLSRRLSE
jgi:N-methylhydantoinase A